MKKILFVCMGNICRSPAADGIMQDMLLKEKLDGEVYVDSAGTIGHHEGERADARMRESSLKRGVELKSISRRFRPESDFRDFDYIIAMDNRNMEDLLSMDEKNIYKEKLYMMTDFCEGRSETEVPDPYYGGDRGFDHVLDICENGCKGLLKKIKLEL